MAASVYFIQGNNTGLVKAGYTTDCNARFQALRSSLSEPFTVLKTIDGSLRVEKILHGMFSRQRVRGEWFTPDNRMLKIISEVQGKTCQECGYAFDIVKIFCGKVFDRTPGQKYCCSTCRERHASKKRKR